MGRRNKFSKKKKAGSPKQPCQAQAAQQAAPPPSPPPPDKPCDLQSVALIVHSGKKSISVSGSNPVASAPLANVHPDTNMLLAGHSVVVSLVAAAVEDGMEGPSRTHRLSAHDSGSAKAKAIFKAIPKSRCGKKHPEITQTPAASDPPPNEANLSVGTTEWSAQDFFKALFGKKPWQDFVFGETAKVVFTADTCGKPAGGKQVKSLDGVVKLTTADEWVLSYQWTHGFAFDFSQKSSYTKDKRADTRIESQESSVQTNKLDEKQESNYVEYREGGKTKYVKGTVDGKEYKATDDSDTKSMDLTRQRQKDDDKELDDQIKEFDKAAGRESEKSITDRLKEAQEFATKQTFNKGMIVKLERNGKAILDTSNIASALEDVQSGIETAMDLLHRLVSLIDSAAKIGIPVSISFGLEIKLRLLAGEASLRMYPERTPPVQGGTYYIEDFKFRAQAAATLKLIEVEVTPKFGGAVRVFHRYLAEGRAEFEGKIGGSASGSLQYTWPTAADFVARGTIPMSIKATFALEGLSCYAIGEGEGKSSIVYTYTAGFDEKGWSKQKHVLKSKRLTVQVTAKYGNKIKDWFGFGSEDPDYKWPKDGPFVLLEQDAISKTW